MIDELNIAVLSDIHLGHKRNPTKEIIKNLKKALPDNHETAALDIIFLAGDVFDNLLSLNEDDIWDIKIWVDGLLRICKKHDILLRVLKGTPSHDWDQPEVFVSLNETGQIGCDLQYIRELSIEYIKRFDINVLYIPDEWNTTAEKTLVQTKELIHAKGLQQVDFAIMHGQFEYQLPPVVKAPKHDSVAYLALVKYLIFIGHVHMFSSFMRIYAQGSFDRLRHNEEEAKGHLRAKINRDGEYTVKFVETINAKKFCTIDCGYLSTEQTLNKLSEFIKTNKIPEHSFLRIKAESTHPLFVNMEELIRYFPKYKWEKKAIKEDITIENNDTEIAYIPITITKENISALLIERLTNKQVNLATLDSAKEILKEVI